MEWPSRRSFDHRPLVGTATDSGPLWVADALGCFPYIFYSEPVESATTCFPWFTGPQVWGTCLETAPLSLRKHRILPVRATRVGGRRCSLLAKSWEPTEGLLPPLGNWTSPSNPLLLFFLFLFFWGLALNYLILFTLHPSFMVQKTCRCKYVPPSLASPPFLIYVISIFLPCTVN